MEQGQVKKSIVRTNTCNFITAKKNATIKESMMYKSCIYLSTQTTEKIEKSSIYNRVAIFRMEKAEDRKKKQGTIK